MDTNNHLKIRHLCECSVLLALSIVLSFVKVYEMPMGGSITLASMLPVLFIGVKLGYKWGLGSAFVLSLSQLAEALIKGNVFVYCVGFSAVAICVLFDYIVPFTILGLSAFAKPKEGEKLNIVKMLITFTVLLIGRFACHYITGVVIWGQWAEDMSKYLYSFLYNGQYMLPEIIITVVISGLIVSSSKVRKIIEND